jgi:hypothetical protein
MFRAFPEDAHWNAERQAGVRGRDRGISRCGPRASARVSTPTPERPPPERCVEAHYLQRARFESIAEPKPRRRQLTEDGNVDESALSMAA